MFKESILGVDRVIEDSSICRSWGKFTLLSNQASLSSNLLYTREVLKKISPENFVSILSPQHGFWGEQQDNMIESPHYIDKKLELPVHSLYSEVREPKESMLQGIDSIVIDLQIVGCRVYTYKYTLANCLKAAKKYNKKVIVLDRPNPLGGETVEGRCLSPDAVSFVGMFSIPMRHALTVGEVAKLFNQEIGAELEVVALSSWDPKSYWSENFNHWIYTSPNLPNFSSVLLYPGMVLFEGTNLSEGRGTSLPFQLIGAPYISDPEGLIKDVSQNFHLGDSGVILRPVFFQPSSGKWGGESCGGVHILVSKMKKVRSYSLALNLLRSFIKFGSDFFKWKEPPYEYDYKSLPINLILGSQEADRSILKPDLDEKFWKWGIEAYLSKASRALVYDREMKN